MLRHPYAYPVLFGALTGAGYAVILRLVDHAWPASDFTHQFLDWTFPILFGIALGLALGASRVRAERARAEHEAVAQLRERLNGTEREQAVWVLVSSLLHELRNPLHTLGLALDELSTAKPGGSSALLVAEARKAVERMNGRFRALGGLAVQPRERARRYDLAELVRRAAEPFDRIAGAFAARVVVRTPTELYVVGDPELTRSALENLISNAVDAVREASGRVVDVELSGRGGRARLEVRDDGGGVPESLRDEVFQPLRSTKAPQHGLGLGLPIARSLARTQGGDVTLEPTRAGACFVLTLPLVEATPKDEK